MWRHCESSSSASVPPSGSIFSYKIKNKPKKNTGSTSTCYSTQCKCPEKRSKAQTGEHKKVAQNFKWLEKTSLLHKTLLSCLFLTFLLPVILVLKKSYYTAMQKDIWNPCWVDMIFNSTTDMNCLWDLLKMLSIEQSSKTTVLIFHFSNVIQQLYNNFLSF